MPVFFCAHEKGAHSSRCDKWISKPAAKPVGHTSVAHSPTSADHAEYSMKIFSFCIVVKANLFAFALLKGKVFIFAQNTLVKVYLRALSYGARNCIPIQ